MIRRRPSTTVVSLPSACVLSRVWALASSVSAALTWTCFALICDLNSPRASSMSRCAYQTSSKRLLGEPAHRGAVALGRREDDLAAGLGGEPVVPSGHGQARRQPLDVPLERAGQGLVEVVDVEDQPPLRRGERAEVGQVRVPAQLHPQPRRGRGGQVGRHRQRRSPVEGERGHQHPAVPDRHQLRHPRLRLPQQQPDRIPGSPGRNSACDSSGATARASLPRATRSARLSCSAAAARARPRPDARAPDPLLATRSAVVVMTTPFAQRRHTVGQRPPRAVADVLVPSRTTAQADGLPAG